jgi:hypothetical protein
MKKRIVVVKAAFLCLANALIAIAQVNGDPKFALYRDGKGLKKYVKDLLKFPLLI